jgi:hypothetical protein
LFVVVAQAGGGHVAAYESGVRGMGHKIGVLAGMMYGGLREAAASAVNSISNRVLLISCLCCIPNVVLVIYGHFQLH